MGIKPIRDWVQKSQYPSSDSKMSMEQWGWEFLRRNKDYQLAYDEISQKGPKEWGLAVKENIDGNMDGYWSVPPALPKEKCCDYIKRNPKYDSRTPLRIFRDRWHVFTPKDPEQEYSDGKKPKFRTATHMRYIWESPDSKADRKIKVTLSPDGVALKFFLMGNINRQLASAKKRLKQLLIEFEEALAQEKSEVSPYIDIFRRQKRKFKNQNIAKYDLMLRLLDADLLATQKGKKIGVTTIGRQLESEGQMFGRDDGSLDSQRKRAIELSSKYLEVALGSPE